MSDLMQEIAALIQPNLRQRLFVAFHYPAASQEAMLAVVPEHLRYMEAVEDKIFLSGPLIAEGKLVDHGLTVLRVASEQEAHDVLRAEPLIRDGLRRYELKLWEIREGTLTVATRLSQSRAALAGPAPA